MKKYLLISILLLLLVIDFFFFHDIFEPKTIPEFLTGILTVLFLILLGLEFFKGGKFKFN